MGEFKPITLHPSSMRSEFFRDGEQNAIVRADGRVNVSMVDRVLTGSFSKARKAAYDLRWRQLPYRLPVIGKLLGESVIEKSVPTYVEYDDSIVVREDGSREIARLDPRQGRRAFMLGASVTMTRDGVADKEAVFAGSAMGASIIVEPDLSLTLERGYEKRPLGDIDTTYVRAQGISDEYEMMKRLAIDGSRERPIFIRAAAEWAKWWIRRAIPKKDREKIPQPGMVTFVQQGIGLMGETPALDAPQAARVINRNIEKVREAHPVKWIAFSLAESLALVKERQDNVDGLVARYVRKYGGVGDDEHAEKNKQHALNMLNRHLRQASQVINDWQRGRDDTRALGR